MKASPQIVEEMSKVNISIIISHCEDNVGWLLEYIGKDYSIKDILIFSKCDKEVEGLEELEELSPVVNITKLPNVGRCDHSYAHYITEQYTSIDRENDGDDIVMFFKDNGRHRNIFIPMDLLLTHASKSGFGCVARVTCRCDQCNKDSIIPMLQHKRKKLERFARMDYNRVKRDDSNAFVSEQYPSLKSWKDDIGFVIPESETMPVCYRGMCVVQKKQFFNQPEESWKKMEASLSRANNIIEGHYAERMWASILSDVDNESARALDEILSPHVTTMSKPQTNCVKPSTTFIHKDAQIIIP